MRLETIRLLADNGSPLEVTLKVRENDVLVTRDGATVQEQLSANPMGDLMAALTHYPREVWINGENMETAPWAGLGNVRISHAGEDEVGSHPKREEWRLKADIPSPAFTARVGGLMVRTRAKTQLDDKLTGHYFTPTGEDEGQHHIPLSAVRVRAFMEIETGEIGDLQEGFNGPEVPDGSELEKRVLGRAQRMIRRTMARPEMPPRYPGRPYGRPTKGENANEYYDEPYAIGVRGKPIVITPWDDGADMDNSIFITAVENLYRQDSELVPVLEWGSSMGGAPIPPAGPEVLKTREVTFETRDHPGHPVWAESITMILEMEDGSVTRHPCGFLLEGTAEYEAEARIVPWEIGKEELRRLLTRAYWTQEGTEHHDWDTLREARQELEERMAILAEHLGGNTSKAARDELQRALDRLHPSIPMPEERITVTSRDGKLQLTLNP